MPHGRSLFHRRETVVMGPMNCMVCLSTTKLLLVLVVPIQKGWPGWVALKKVKKVNLYGTLYCICKALRYVSNKGITQFICHTHTNHTCLYYPAAWCHRPSVAGCIQYGLLIPVLTESNVEWSRPIHQHLARLPHSIQLHNTSVIV